LLQEANRTSDPTINPSHLASWEAYQQRGIERDAAGDHAGAADDFSHAIRIGPPNAALRYLRGIALLHANEPQQAASEFEEGLKLEPNNLTLRTLLQEANRTSDPPTNPSLIKADGDVSSGPAQPR
jgi:tetratricopeptide (TPR) repeat protein